MIIASKITPVTKQQINKQYENLNKMTKKELIEILIETDKQLEFMRNR